MVIVIEYLDTSTGAGTRVTRYCTCKTRKHVFDRLRTLNRHERYDQTECRRSRIFDIVLGAYMYFYIKIRVFRIKQIIFYIATKRRYRTTWSSNWVNQSERKRCKNR